MKLKEFSALEALLLKPERADAYGIPREKPVYFRRIQTRDGYAVPWIVCQSSNGLGHYKPSDFKRSLGYCAMTVFGRDNLITDPNI